MNDTFPPTAYILTAIADTMGEFADFAPYVPSISDNSDVAFQAALKTGDSGVFVWREEKISRIAEASAVVAGVVSHPDIDAEGRTCFYGIPGPNNRASESDRAVFAANGNEVRLISRRAGPLGPTMNNRGHIAYRGVLDGGEGLFVWRDGKTDLIADTAGSHAAFQGLPLINDRGQVLFRADLKSGGQSINLVDRAGKRSTVIDTDDAYASMNFFPTLNDAGIVGFCATMRSGIGGAFLVADGRVRAIADSSGAFESFRTVLIDGTGRALLCATPKGGTLGVFSGPDPRAHRVLAIGDAMMGSAVTEFALNPVSINQRGQFAVRVKLADERQMVLRGDHA